MEALALKLVQQYVQGWLHNDIEMICSALNEDCVIIESHGPKYEGLSHIKKWFQKWLEAEGKVLRWDMRSFHYCAQDASAFFEWDFVCVANDERYELSGMSLVKFVDSKISFIHEYCMTRPAFEWLGDRLVSE